MPSCAITPPFSRRAALGLGGGALLEALINGGQASSAAAIDVATLEANKALARRVFAEAINQRSTAASELFEHNYVDYGGALRQMPGPAGMPLTLDEFHALNPPIVAMVDDAIAEGDLVALRVAWRSEHQPSGTHLVGRTMHVFRIEQGLIVAGWSVGWEWLELLSAGSRRRPGNPLIG